MRIHELEKRASMYAARKREIATWYEATRKTIDTIMGEGSPEARSAQTEITDMAGDEYVKAEKEFRAAIRKLYS